MDQVASSDEHPSLFTAEELKGIDVTESGKDFIEVECGCTHRRYGDTSGKLRVFANGKVEIACDCYQGCKGAKLSPSEFEKHAGVTGMSNWRVHVWVFVDGNKVQLKKTKLLKYHKGSASDPSTSVRPRRSRTTHRDELVTCTACRKERRFYRRDQDECKIHHQAAANETWTCSDYFYEDITCENEEERASKKRFRGCPRRPVCKGCTSCVCFGCSTCRFADCDCRACVDFIQNAEP